MVDEALLKQYTRFSLWMEEKGVPQKKQPILMITGYSLLGATLMSSFPDSSINFDDINLLEKIVTIPSLFLFQPTMPLVWHDFAYSVYYDSKQDQTTTSTIAEDRFSYVSKKIQRVVRLPIFLAGAYLGYKGIKPAVIGDSMDGLGVGLTSIVTGVGLATSMYLKDTNPTLLDKEPAWKRAYNWLTERGQSLVHRPVSVPVPTNYS